MTRQPLHRNEIVHNLINLISSPDFIQRHRHADKAFSRERKLPFSRLIIFLLNMVKSSLQAELNQFFRSLNQSDMSEQAVSKAAFSKARKNLKYQSFIELNQVLSQAVIQHSNRRWQNFRICAVDGSTLNLPNHSLLREHFDPNASGRPQARASQLYDVLNHITLDATLSPMFTGERTLALGHLEHAQLQDLILYDRGCRKR